MRRACSAVLWAVLLSACGGSGGGGGGGVATVPGGSTPAPTPSPSASPSPVYPRFDALTGDQRFRSACAALAFEGLPPGPQMALAFGSGLVLNYAAADRRYDVTGDYLAATSFGPGDADPAAAASVQAYVKTVDGFQNRLTIGQPVAGGQSLAYVRGMIVRGRYPGAINARLYQCVIGVPTLAGDLPAAAVAYSRVGVSGTAYVAQTSGALLTYVLGTSVATLRFDPAAGRVAATIRLSGQLLGPTGASGEAVELGSYTVDAPLDAGRTSFYASAMPSTDRSSQFAYLAGSFFGPQGAEAAGSFALYAVDPRTGARMSVQANLLAIQ